MQLVVTATLCFQLDTRRSPYLWSHVCSAIWASISMFDTMNTSLAGAAQGVSVMRTFSRRW